MWWALSEDRGYRVALGVRPKYIRSTIIVATLCGALGSVFISAFHIDIDPFVFRVLAWLFIAACAVVGFIGGYRLVRKDHEHNFVHNEPHFARLAGALVGANLAVTVGAALSLFLASQPADWRLWLVGSVGVAAGAWSYWRCRKKVRGTRILCWRAPTALAVVTDAMVAGIVAVFTVEVFDDFPFDSDLLFAMYGALVGLLAWIVLAILSAKLKPKPGRMVDGDLALLCPSCGYDLRYLPQPRCPECGLAFDEAQLRRARHTTPFPITLWHPLGTGPLAGMIVGFAVAGFGMMLWDW